MSTQSEEIEQAISSFSQLMEARMFEKVDNNVGWKYYFDKDGVYEAMYRKLNNVLEASNGGYQLAKQNLVDIANYAMMWHDVMPEDISEEDKDNE